METCYLNKQPSIENTKTLIHPTAIISEKADIASDVEVGPYAIIHDNTFISKGNQIGPHVIIEPYTTLGKNNEIHAGAIIGNTPQDLKYQGEKACVEIGDKNIIREYVTINRGTSGGGGLTKIGNHNLLMASSHIAHDSNIGDHNIIGHASLVGGHVTVKDWVTIGVLSGIHQFVRLGTMSMVGANSKIVKDAPPFTLVNGHPAKLYGINYERLRRNQYPHERTQQIKYAYKIIFQSGLSLKEAEQKLKKTYMVNSDVKEMLDFIFSSERGIYR